MPRRLLSRSADRSRPCLAEADTCWGGLDGCFELGDMLAGSGERVEDLAIGIPPFDRGVSFGPFKKRSCVGPKRPLALP